MAILKKTNRTLATRFIKDFEDIFNNQVRAKHGMLAGWISITAIAASISVVANAFHLLSHNDRFSSRTGPESRAHKTNPRNRQIRQWNLTIIKGCEMGMRNL